MPPKFRLIPNLPGGDFRVRDFGWTKPTADPSVGVLVEFDPLSNTPWVGNFAPGGWTGHCSALPFIDGRRVVVLAAGRTYLVDPERHRVDAELSEFAVDAYEATEPPLLIVNWHGICFEAYDASGMKWRTRRVSWDGIQNAEVTGSILTAETWSAPYQRWVPVSVDLHTGQATGGAYDFSDAANDETLAKS